MIRLHGQNFKLSAAILGNLAPLQLLVEYLTNGDTWSEEGDNFRSLASSALRAEWKWRGKDTRTHAVTHTETQCSATIRSLQRGFISAARLADRPAISTADCFPFSFQVASKSSTCPFIWMLNGVNAVFKNNLIEISVNFRRFFSTRQFPQKFRINSGTYLNGLF